MNYARWSFSLNTVKYKVLLKKNIAAKNFNILIYYIIFY